MKMAMINIAKKFEEGWKDYYSTDGHSLSQASIFRCFSQDSPPGGRKGLLAPHLALQIHDELLIELPRQDLYRVREIVKREMETAIALAVPMVVNLFWGERWGSLEPVPP